MDPREQALNDAARRVMVQSNYDAHFSSLEDRLIMETKLYLARFDALMKFTVATANGNHAPDHSNGNQWQHRLEHHTVTVLGRGLLGEDTTQGTRLVCYRNDQDERVIFSKESEFHLQYEPV